MHIRSLAFSHLDIFNFEVVKPEVSRAVHFSRSGALLFKRQGSECAVDVPSDPGT